MRFRHIIIDTQTPGGENDVCLIADFTGDGRLDIMVAEMGLGRHPDPRVLIYRNLGDGRFGPFVVASGRPTHEAKVGVLGDDSLPSIVGKPYRPGDYVDMWRNLG